MTSTTSRVLQLLELLQSADIRTVTELAERLAVNERTVRRHVQHLLDLEIPVESVRGRYGGYRIRAGYRMPPVILSDDEAVALLLGLVHAQAGADAPDVAIQTAMSKIRRSLPAQTARRLESLLETAVLDAPTHRDVPDAGSLLTIADAIKQRRPLDLRYLDAAGTPSRRTVLPYDLIAHSGRWYLIAFDTARRSERTFRVDRIRTARAVSGAFEPPARREAISRLVDGFADADYPWRVVLRIRASDEHIRRHLPASVAVLRPVPELDGDGPPTWHRADIRAHTLDWIPAVIAALDCDVVIEGPEELRQAARAAATRLLDAADASGGTTARPDVSKAGPATRGRKTPRTGSTVAP
ncbi:transcriptional regulator [Cellulomonas chitinilytica]|uniref:Transcriptional regulator n=1 Tax=Cellulomonas chitinilytica TaxID=398759 RepID=A0A919P3B7_9CELL|nr:YafY family protein [Cellulomonas chitinilytica]GIG20659.1 transcriptional regulator [Cellulomonas chitinilytica]